MTTNEPRDITDFDNQIVKVLLWTPLDDLWPSIAVKIFEDDGPSSTSTAFLQLTREMTRRLIRELQDACDDVDETEEAFLKTTPERTV